MKHEVIFEDWHYTCGEPSCCDDYGTRLIVNGKVVSEDVTTLSAVEDVLTALGIEFELTVRDEEGSEF